MRNVRKETDEEKKHMGEMLVKCRKELGYNQKNFAEEIEVSARMLAKYEQGLVAPPDYVRRVLRRRYHVDMNAFLCKEDYIDEMLFDEKQKVEMYVVVEKVFNQASLKELMAYMIKIIEIMGERLK